MDGLQFRVVGVAMATMIDDGGGDEGNRDGKEKSASKSLLSYGS